jgi:hypothetical protein
MRVNLFHRIYENNIGGWIDKFRGGRQNNCRTSEETKGELHADVRGWSFAQVNEGREDG